MEQNLNLPEEREAFLIDSDGKADWAIRKIRDIIAERDRRVAACKVAISDYESILNKEMRSAEEDIGYFTSLLQAYFGTVEHKATKTQETYWLPSGRLKLKLSAPKIEKDDSALMTAYPDYIRQTPTLAWAELKKRLSVAGSVVIDTETGEIVHGASVVESPAVFSVEV